MHLAICLPPRNGVRASSLQLPPGAWSTVLDCLCAHFAAISRSEWQDRIARDLVCDAQGMPITATTPYRVGLSIRYYREVRAEEAIPFAAGIVHVDEHLIVADKPHFLPVTPSGGHVEETLLARTRNIGATRPFTEMQSGNVEHRIERTKQHPATKTTA